MCIKIGLFYFFLTFPLSRLTLCPDYYNISNAETAAMSNDVGADCRSESVLLEKFIAEKYSLADGLNLVLFYKILPPEN